MNTLGMMLGLVGITFCWIPGFVGWFGSFVSFCGVSIAIFGMTNKKTSPSNLGMNLATHTVGLFSVLWGTAFQIKHAAGLFDFIVLPFSFNILLAITSVLYSAFIIIQLIGRNAGQKKLKIMYITFAFVLVLTIMISGSSLITVADRAML